MNEKVYIHEYIDIIGHNRGRYMYHMTANWSPAAQEDRHQLCFGVWGVVGSTGRWPQVVNIWEEDGFDGLRAVLRARVGPPRSAGSEVGGLVGGGRWAQGRGDRPAGRARPVDADHRRGLRGGCRAATSTPTSRSVCPAVRRRTTWSSSVSEVMPLMAEFGWVLAGAWATAMTDDDECFVLWAVPTWAQWAEREKARRTHPGLMEAEARGRDITERTKRILLVDAALSPMRLGRQPSRADRTEHWDG